MHKLLGFMHIQRDAILAAHIDSTSGGPLADTLYVKIILYIIFAKSIYRIVSAKRDLMHDFKTNLYAKSLKCPLHIACYTLHSEHL